MRSESCSVVSNSLQPHGLYSSWNSPGLNTGVGSLSLLQWIFSIQASNPCLPQQVDSLPAEPQGKPKNTGVGRLFLLQQIFSSPGIELVSPALQADSLPTELWILNLICTYLISVFKTPRFYFIFFVYLTLFEIIYLMVISVFS